MLYVSDNVTKNGLVSHFWGLVFLSKTLFNVCHLDYAQFHMSLL